jgi:hypothetical protein
MPASRHVHHACKPLVTCINGLANVKKIVAAINESPLSLCGCWALSLKSPRKASVCQEALGRKLVTDNQFYHQSLPWPLAHQIWKKITFESVARAACGWQHSASNYPMPIGLRTLCSLSQKRGSHTSSVQQARTDRVRRRLKLKVCPHAPYERNHQFQMVLVSCPSCRDVLSALFVQL